MRDVRELYPLGTTPYGTTSSVPPFLASTPVHEVVHDFGAGKGLAGTGVYLGNGLVLTAGHVAAQWFPPGFGAKATAFVGSMACDPHWTVRFLPPRGTFPGGKRVVLTQSMYGNFQDWAVLHNERLAGARGVAGVRPTGSLRPGERVWVLGDKTWSEVRVSQGAFAELDGANLRITNIEVEGGFSGSPILDDQGRLVGIAVARFHDGDLYAVRTEAIAEALQRYAPGSEAAKKLAPALAGLKNAW